jgi:hypothetical protein
VHHCLRYQAEADSGKDDVASRLNIDISKPLKADEVLPSIKQYERKSRYEIEEVRNVVRTYVYVDMRSTHVHAVTQSLSFCKGKAYV